MQPKVSRVPFCEPTHLELVPPDRRRYFVLQLRGRVRGRCTMRPVGGTRSARACLRLEAYYKMIRRSRCQAEGSSLVNRFVSSRYLL